MKKIFKNIVIVIVILALAAGGYYTYTNYSNTQKAKAAAASIETAVLAKGKLVSTISATGTVRSNQTANLNWQTSGTVEKVSFKVGDTVKAGDQLANLSQTSLPQNVIMAQSDLASAQQALDNLYTNAETSRVKAMQDIVTYEQAVRDAQYQLDNFTVPSNQVGMSAVEAVTAMKQKLDQARAAFEPYKNYPSTDQTRKDLKDALDQAQADYNAAVKRLKYEYDLEVAQANLDKANQDYNKWKDGPTPDDVAAAKAKVAATQATLNQVWIKAPFNGTITLAYPQVGDQVANNTLAFRIDDLSSMFVDMQVSEVDIGQIKVGQEANVKFDALRNKMYHGKVNEVALIGDQSGNVVNFIVTVQLTDVDKEVRSGMTTEVDIVVAQREDALLIPNQAIFVEDGKQVVYIDKPGQGIVRVEITGGISSDAYTELLTGDLQAGDQIVLTPPSKVNTLSTTGPFRMMRGGSPENNQPNQNPGGQP
jgi:HlyD family secretion protein